MAKVAEIRRWHVDGHGWSDIGYHYVIDRDGTIEFGRPISRAGAHTIGRNSNSIGICLIGGFGGSAEDDFADNFTSQQLDALKRTIYSMKKNYGNLMISGHNEYARKACPCFDVKKTLGK